MKINKKNYILIIIFVVLIVLILVIFSLSNKKKNYYKDSKIQTANIDNKEYKIILKDYYLYLEINNKFIKITDEKILDMKVFNLDNSGNDEILTINLKNENEIQDNRVFGNDIIFYKINYQNNDIKVEEFYRNDFTIVKPWMIDAGNMDDDEDNDVFVGVYKNTVFHKEIRNRPFFFSWNGEFLYKKWTGSYFSKNDLIDIAFVDYFNKNNDEIAVLEKDEEGRYIVSLYSWLEFGFIKIAESDYYNNIDHIESVKINNKNYIQINSNENNNNNTKILELVDNDENLLKLIESKK